jgi:hypothetical protein
MEVLRNKLRGEEAQRSHGQHPSAYLLSEGVMSNIEPRQQMSIALDRLSRVLVDIARNSPKQTEIEAVATENRK